MAHESFEDDEVAEVLNRDYICIKVDREERPDVDAVYMAACQVLTGQGGWPLTIVMTPEQKPFWAGTYLPKTMRYGRLGLMELLEAITKQWNTNRNQLLRAGEEMVSYLQAPQERGKGSKEPSKKLIQDGVSWYRRSYDGRWGGFGSAPKFPAAHNLLFLLGYAQLEDDPQAQDMVEHTMTQMYRGGLFDHIGGGFSRYSTDERWLVPHFEKMLYDNALLTLGYLEAYQVTKRPLYRDIAKRTLDYVLRELTDELGGFYCGQDADSEGVEGKYYVFTPQEMQELLGKRDGAYVCEAYDIRKQGNFEGKSIPNLIASSCVEELDPRLHSLFEILYDYRLHRTKLHKDDKVLTSWNALMIAACARAGRLLPDTPYLSAAETAHRFIIQNLKDASGRLLLRWRQGEAAHLGQLDDYTFYCFALLELYQTSFDIYVLEECIEVAEQMAEHFWDEQAGGFYLYANDAEALISRPKEIYDGAMPSGNGMAGLVLGRLARLTGDTKWMDRSEKQLRFLTAAIEDYPAGYSVSLLAFLEALSPSQELICVSSEQETPQEWLKLLQSITIPNISTLLKTKSNHELLARLAPFTAEYPIPSQGSMYYLCRNGACLAPVNCIEDLLSLLKTK